ncbi:UNVERIFIED_CONTAM: hypothetical protein Sangu_2991600 [Sesamum angustifolium]|uniref:Uncharacterized protein n=1 Tax=Sesamum angustifolium TaxID=2727405 RepID=A0AAW2KMI5_9LAMI
MPLSLAILVDIIDFDCCELPTFPFPLLILTGAVGAPAALTVVATTFPLLGSDLLAFRLGG